MKNGLFGGEVTTPHLLKLIGMKRIFVALTICYKYVQGHIRLSAK